MFKKLREKSKNKKGFTMVELIVVIVIILILAAALVPQLLRYVDTARRANCQSDAATILAQLQADYVASQASEQTGVTVGADGTFEIAGVDVTLATAEITAVADVVIPEGGTAAAVYFVTGDDTLTRNITSFGYNNGDYTAVWTGGAWIVEEN